MIPELEVFFASLNDRMIAYGLTEAAAREVAQRSHWIEDLNESVTITPTIIPVREIDGELRYTGPNDTNHVC